MKFKILVYLMLIMSVSTLDAEKKSNNDESKTQAICLPQISLACGIQFDSPSVRSNLKYYSKKMTYSLRYTDYDFFLIGTKTYSAGVTLDHKEFALIFNKVVYSPYSNIHCMIGIGLLYSMKKVRDERISYENWTSKKNNDVGIPLELNIEIFLIPSKFILNFGVKTNIYENIFEYGLVIDIGFGLGKRINK
ncbi:MAG: hypothetical protein K9N07_00555 [Candidatus Cloacimonetes bacterium]|nr:hypothetical protein [Candidatus Cloacimonadota bacterium]